MESLIAIAVFGLGFVAVAAIFPVAITMQKKAAGNLLTQQLTHNVKAMLKSRKFIHTDLTNPSNPKFIKDVLQNGNPNKEVQPVLKTTSPGNLLDPPGKFPGGIFERWMLNDRSYFFVRNNVDTNPAPLVSNAYHPKHAAELGGPYANEFKRNFYWVPLIRRTQIPTQSSDWQVFVFILHRDDATYDRLPSAFSDDWANWDGFRSPYWYVPGVRSLVVTNVTDNQFTVNNTWTGKNPGIGLEIVPGDLVLDSNGVRHTVLGADVGSITVNGAIPQMPKAPNKLWYARPAAAGRPSPARQILILTGVVE